MIKRTIEISQEPASLRVRHEQLELRRGEELLRSIPCEDIGVVVVDHPQTTYSHGALASLAEHDAVVVICGNNHLPSALLLPLADHGQVVWRLQDQLRARRPLCKRLWKQLIQAKIRAAARNLPLDEPARKKLLALAREVRSGDPKNVEAHAARVYWSKWVPEEAQFRRDTDGEGINSLLNYGYAIVRAALARAIVAAGMHPAIGLKHRHRANAFCLADDLIEPLRPLVDARARDLYRQGLRGITRDTKAGLLQLLADEVQLGQEIGPLMVNLHRFVASFAQCLRAERTTLLIPTALSREEGARSASFSETSHAD